MYENVKLTEEQRKELAVRKIKNPYGSFRQITDGIEPMYLTIDRDSGNWLAWCYRHHDLDIDVSEFVFMYENVPITVQAECVHENGVAWKITRVDADREILDDEFLSALRKAFKAYGTDGTPETSGGSIFGGCRKKI